MISWRSVYNLPILLLFIAGILPGTPVSALEEGKSVFLQGDYLEVGISPEGWFGPSFLSAETVPSGFHNTSTEGLGFVADYQMDGWDMGSPAYGGDYVAAGSPYEGFALEWSSDGDEAIYCQGNDVCGPDFTNTSLSDTSSGDNLSATWTGETETKNGQKLRVVHDMHFNRSDLFILIDTTIENTGNKILDSVKFLRGIDPDNDVAWPGGDFDTTIQVLHQPGETDNPEKALIRAAGTRYPDMLIFLGTADSRARVSIDRDWLMDINQVLDAPSINPRLADEALALAWRFGTIKPGESVVVHYFYSFGTDAQAEVLLGNLTKRFCTGTEITLLGGSRTAGDWTVRVPPAIVAEGTCLEVDLRDSASGPGTGPEMKALGRMIEARMISPNGTSLNIIPIPLQVCYKYNAEDLERAFFNPVNLMIGSALLGELNWEFPATSVFPAIQQVCFSTLDLGFYGLFMPVVLPSTGYAPDEPVIQSLHSTVTVSKSQDDMWLVIPRMGIRTPIVGVPVTSDGWDVSWLGNAAGWLQGSAFPTWQGNSVLTGHVWGVTNQPGPFINLNTLWFGDQVIVHAWGQEYIYEVRSIKQVLPEDLGELLTHEELPWLTLVTCRGFDPGEGTYHWRVLVRAVLVEIK